MLGLIKRVALRAMRVVAPLAVIGVAGAAAAADLQVSGYSWDPDPAANGGQAKFTITVANNGPGAVSDAVVNIAVPSNFSVQTGEFPTYCILSGVVGSQSLACSLPTLPVGTFEFDYMADAKEIGSRTASASISSPTNVDNNPANNTLSVSPAVEAGADLVVTKNDNLPTDSIPAGGIINYTLKAVNQGPDATGAIRLVDNLPAASNFEFLTAAGTNWNCSRSGTAVTCNYTGPAVTGALPDVTVSGRVLATGGTITNNAFVAITGSGVQDPKPDNNTATPVVTTI
ncbi:hypothetical protein [Brevundimonas sp.]|uniref:hypothetical protein n=1 Tax=Brevundimonas sp. TaxID=1871086 RepID=UPI002FC829C0